MKYQHLFSGPLLLDIYFSCFQIFSIMWQTYMVLLDIYNMIDII